MYAFFNIKKYLFKISKGKVVSWCALFCIWPLLFLPFSLSLSYFSNSFSLILHENNERGEKEKEDENRLWTTGLTIINGRSTGIAVYCPLFNLYRETIPNTTPQFSSILVRSSRHRQAESRVFFKVLLYIYYAFSVPSKANIMMKFNWVVDEMNTLSYSRYCSPRRRKQKYEYIFHSLPYYHHNTFSVTRPNGCKKR